MPSLSETAAMLRGRGAEGVPRPAGPTDFGAGFAMPRTPNAALAASPGSPLPATLRHPPLPLSPARAFAALEAVAAAMPRTAPLARFPDRLQAQWVARSALVGYPDVVVGQVEAVPGAGGSAVVLYSRSLIGHSDLGANARRLRAWLAALDEAARAG